MKAIVAILTVFVAMTAGAVAYACTVHASVKNFSKDENHNIQIVFSVNAQCDGSQGCGGTLGYKVISSLDGHTFKREGSTTWQAPQSGPATAEAAVHLTFLDEEVVSVSVTSVTCQ